MAGRSLAKGVADAAPVTGEATATARLRAPPTTVAVERMGPHTTRRPGVSSARGFPFVEAGAREGSQPEWAKTPLFAVAWSRGPNVRNDARRLEPRDRARPSAGGSPADGPALIVIDGTDWSDGSMTSKSAMSRLSLRCRCRQLFILINRIADAGRLGSEPANLA